MSGAWWQQHGESMCLEFTMTSIQNNQMSMNQTNCLAALIWCLSWCCSHAQAGQSAEQPPEQLGWTIQTSVYTRHFDKDPEHNNSQNMLSVEALLKNDWVAGAAMFDNSFHQRSQLVYAGKSWSPFGSDFWYFKLRGGLLHGYKEPYEDKIPFNGLGIAPVIIPALGFRYRGLVAEGILGGVAVVTFTAGVSF